MKEKKDENAEAMAPHTQNQGRREDAGNGSKCVIVADADYVDGVAFHLIVNFERMLGRRIPPADLARWLECVALDGGLREGNHEVNVVLIHDRASLKMENFVPADFGELTGKAFRSNLGEFIINAVRVEELTTKDELVNDIVEFQLSLPDVNRLIVIPNTEEGTQWKRIAALTSRPTPHPTDITLLAMQPLAGGRFQQEILGYSLMQALGIHADELK